MREIDSFCNQDYLMVATNSVLLQQKLPKTFLIPYTQRYILDVDSSSKPKVIYTQFCKEILENS